MTISTVPSGTFAKIAPVLLESGWGAPIPSSPEGKGAILPNWSYYNLHAALPETVDLWASKYPDANVALALSREIGVVAVDIDIDDRRDADRIKAAAADCLGVTDFIRVGREPRQVRFYRSAEDNTIPDVWRKGLEIKAGSGLITTHGWHSGVRAPYYYPCDDIVNATPEELPIISIEQVKAFLREATGTETLGRTLGDGNEEGNGGASLLMSLLGGRNGDEALDFLADCLAGAVEGERHHRVLNTVVAAAMRGFTDDEILDKMLPIAVAIFGNHENGFREVYSALRWIRYRGVTDRNQTLARVRAEAPWLRGKK